jgi:hypothetical protein
VYSLVSASVLAIDLSRHPSGAAVADVVDRVLALTPAELDLMTAPVTQGPRERVMERMATAPRMSTLMGGVAATVRDRLPSQQEGRTILDALNETLVGGLPDLLELLRHEPPLQDAPAAAVQVALDAVTGAWAGPSADLADLAALHAPWARAVDPVPPALPAAVGFAALRRLLDEVGRRTPSQWRRTADAHRAQRGGLRWSNAMHQACRAAFEHDRLVPIARAQLAAARALRLSGASTGEDAHAIAMSVTAATQAMCTADVLEVDVHHALVRAWEAGS